MPDQDRAGNQSKAERMSGWRRAGLVRVDARERQDTTYGSDDSAQCGLTQLLRAPLCSAKC